MNSILDRIDTSTLTRLNCSGFLISASAAFFRSSLDDANQDIKFMLYLCTAIWRIDGGGGGVALHTVRKKISHTMQY